MGRLKKNIPLAELRRGDHIKIEKYDKIRRVKVLYNDPENQRIMLRESWGSIFGIILSWNDLGWCRYNSGYFRDYKIYNYTGKYRDINGTA